MLEKHNGRYFRNGAEITAGEYADILADTKAKAQWVDRVCAGTASAQDVPEQWREEIIQRTAGRQAAEDSDPELTAEEALGIILGGNTE